MPPEANMDIYIVADTVEAIAGAKEDGDGLKRFDVLAYSGGLLYLKNFKHPVVVDLETIRGIDKTKPILRDHDSRRPVGHTEVLAVHDDQLRGKVVVSVANADAHEVAVAAENAFPWQMSIGARPGRLKTVKAGETVFVNGRTFRGPLVVAYDAWLMEISFVAVGADRRAAAQLAASVFFNNGVFDMEFEKWCQERNLDLTAMSEDTQDAIRAMYDREMEKAKDEAIRAEMEQAERKIEAGGDGTGDEDAAAGAAVKKMRLEAALESRRIAAISKVDGVTDDIRAQAIEAGWDADRTELEVLRASRPSIDNSQPTRHRSRLPESRVIEAALCLRGNMSEDEVAKHYDEKTVDAAMSGRMNGFGLQALFYSVLQAAGDTSWMPGMMNNATIKAAFRADQQLIQAGDGFSSTSVSGILSNVANKHLLSAYNGVPSVARQVCAPKDVSDFKQHTGYRLNMLGEFEEVGAGGEIKHATLSEESLTYQAKTFGKGITLTRQMIINDDLGAFLDILKMLGKMCGDTIETKFFEMLLSNPGDFFSSGNGNYLSGAGSVLSIDALTTAEQVFLDQKDANGKPININPKWMLVPTALKVLAEQIFGSIDMFDVSVSETGASAVGKTKNVHAGKFRPIVSPYLNNASITGYSATAWYLLADPALVAIAFISYLNGNRKPFLESSETDFDTLGMKWRAYFDWGLDMADEKGGVKVAGA